MSVIWRVSLDAAVLLCFFSIAWAEPSTPWYGQLDNKWGGHFKLYGSALNYGDNSFYSPDDTGQGYDGLINLRLKDTLFLTEKVSVEAHYQAFFEWGDSYKNYRELKNSIQLFPGGFAIDKWDMDKRRLFDLTKVIKETDHHMAWNRLDRLLFTISDSWGDVSVGRQAVTWGNGLIFNPMDLFNPFSPSDTQREYKTGDDLVSLRCNTESLGELNLLYVPRRDPSAGHVDKESSSFAGKLHFFAGTNEVDLMFARHYGENLAGIGLTGYLGGAALRSDITWSTLSLASGRSGYMNLVANLDYSWTLLGKNFYGMVEYFHSGLGEDDYSSAYLEPELVERLGRGEMFTIGRDYLSLMVHIELHPLFNLYLSMINNIADPSGVVQPRAIWSLSENSTLNFGVNIHYGKKGTEFGGFLVQGTENYTTFPHNAYMQLTCYF